MDKPEPDFTMEDLLAELRAELPSFAQGEAMTTKEMASAVGVSENTMRDYLRGLKAQGLIRVTRKEIVALNNRLMVTTAWEINNTERRGGETDGSNDSSNSRSGSDPVDNRDRPGSQAS